MLRLVNVSVRVQIALSIAALATGVLLAMAVAIYGLFQHQLEQQLDDTIRQRSAAFEQLVTCGDGLMRLTPVVDPDSQRARAVVALRLYDASGRLISDESPAAGTSPEEATIVRQVLDVQQPDLKTVDLSDDKDYLVLATPVHRIGCAGGVLITGIERLQLTAPLDQLRLILGGLLPATAVLLGAGGFMIARRALRPVTKISAAARRITAGDLRQRIPVSGSADEIGELSTTLNAMISQLAAAAERERRFTADAAHELRTPLAATLTALEVTLARDREPAAYRHALLQVQREIQRLESLTRKLLLLSRLDTRDVAAHFGLVDFRAELVLAVADFASRHPETRVRQIIGPETPDPLVVTGDGSLLRTAVSNLLDNAVNHGGAHVQITIGLTVQTTFADTITLHVCDDGTGVPADLAPHVFQRFRLGDQARKTGGSGLGLSIVEAIASAHGGAVWLETRGTGAGAGFVISLPLANAAGPAVHAARPAG